MKKITYLAFGSICIGILVLCLKYYAYKTTGSIALYSDALESVVNVVASITAYIAVYISIKPADFNHNYGHYKAEYFSAIFEGICIVITALMIIYKAFYNHTNEISTPILGLSINAIATTINGIWAYLLIYNGKKYKFPALTADGKHLVSDVVTSIGILLGISLAVITGWMILDTILAILTAIHILWFGWKIIQDSINGLMDAAPNANDLHAINKIITENYLGALEMRNLKARYASRAIFIDFYLIVPGDMLVKDAHAICDRIEIAIKKTFPISIVNIHVEPNS